LHVADVLNTKKKFQTKWSEHVESMKDHGLQKFKYTRVYPKVSGLATRRENCKWYSSLPPVAVISLICELF